MPPRLTTDEFIKRAKEINGGRFDYSKVIYTLSKNKIILVCSIHGPFKIRATSHMEGKGCFKCGVAIPRPSRRLTQKEFIDKAIKTHGNKYDYSKAEYIHAKVKVKIICPIHGEFLQSPDQHLRGHACDLCAHEITGKCRVPTTQEFIDRAIKIHGNKYDLSFVEYGKNAYQKVKILCRKHGPYKVSPHSFLSGSGCPNCKNSRGETKIREFLQSKEIKFTAQKSFKTCKHKNRLRFDFYLKDYRLLIEYDGQQHFKPYRRFGGTKALKSLKIRDEIKNQWAMKKDYNLLRIKHTSFNDLESILESVLKAIKDP
jgi:very-short-patch-repair endonuclease